MAQFAQHAILLSIPHQLLQAREALRALADAHGGDLVRKRLAALHPQSLSDLDSDTVERFRESSAETVAKLLEGPHAHALKAANANADGEGTAETDADAAIRLLLVCQFNGFRSGLVCIILTSCPLEHPE